MTAERVHAEARESARLLRFWNDRYQRLTLSESGWLGAGERLNERLYACKSQALTGALHALQLPEAFSVLDAGCGLGYFARFYRSAHPRANYTGVDISQRVIDHLRSETPGIRAEAADLSAWRDPRAMRFDVVQALDVCQMLLDDVFLAAVIANLSSQLADGGALIVTACFPAEDVQPAAYLKHRSRPTWTRLLTSCGLAITRDVPMYYWLPGGGPRNKYARYALARAGTLPLYVIDRAALKFRVPQPSSWSLDNRLRLVTIQRARV